MNPETLSKYRMFFMAAQEMIPLVEGMHKEAHEKLINAYRSNDTTLLPLVARMESLWTLLEEIKSKAKTYEHHLSKEHTL